MLRGRPRVPPQRSRRAAILLGLVLVWAIYELVATGSGRADTPRPTKFVTTARLTDALFPQGSLTELSPTTAPRGATGTSTPLEPTTLAPEQHSSVDPRREEVVQALRHSWNGYRKFAWGKDEYMPISRQTKNWGEGKGIGSTIVDALDTLIMCGLKDEAEEALSWVEHNLTFDQNIKLSMFETTIRVVGGLLSAHQLTGRARLLELAEDLVRRMSPAFETDSGIPNNYVNLRTGISEGAAWNGGAAILSEFGSLQLEFRTLAFFTKQRKYDELARRAVVAIQPHCKSGLCPRNFLHGKPAGLSAGLGSFGDSYYEYLLKQWILTGKKEDDYKRWWDAAAEHIVKTTVKSKGGHVIPNGAETSRQMEHLACFSGGLFALSYLHTGNTEHLTLAKGIAETCRFMYQNTKSGLSPDVINFDAPAPRIDDPKFILRPETVETYFYLWRVTKDPKYRDWGYDYLLACNKHLKVEGGYVGAADVTELPVRQHDQMETFWFAESLKYLYLLFSDDSAVDLNNVVFNTEAHPLRVIPPMSELDRS